MRKNNKADKPSIVQKFFNTVHKTNPVGVAGSGTPLLGKLEPTIATEKKSDKAEKVQKTAVLCPATQGASWWGLRFQARTKARVTQNGIN